MSHRLPYVPPKQLEMAEIAQPVRALFVAHVRLARLIVFLNLTVFCHHKSHVAIPDQFSGAIMMETN